jgi:hypothetical protein
MIFMPHPEPFEHVEATLLDFFEDLRNLGIDLQLHAIDNQSNPHEPLGLNHAAEMRACGDAEQFHIAPGCHESAPAACEK